MKVKSRPHLSFTLLEVLIGTSLVAITVAVAGSAFFFTNRLLYRERRALVASSYCHSILEDLLYQTEFDNATLTTGTHTIPGGQLPTNDQFWLKAGPTVLYNVTSYQIDPADATSSNEAKKITVTIAWNEDDKGVVTNENVTLTSIKIK
ncbi:MAG: type II secretion system protein [Candidatus Omnitrophica bacterium]|nr:type II secretion system protein [Candidatus Omnitrophota bacterium]